MNNEDRSQLNNSTSESYADLNRNGHNRAPLYERLLQYANSGNRSYHVPGHKNGAVYTRLAEHPAVTLSMDYMQEMLRLDVTEIEGTDDLHHPEDVIREGQELAARCFGAEETYWLVGGSTSGNLALLLSVCQEPGDLILVQRNVHKSVIHGLMLAGARAVFLTPELEPSSGLAVVPSLETIRLALERYPAARAVLLTSPNYYGMGTDLKAIADECHARNVPLLVDEAHGAHFGHHPRFPHSALAAGADGVVQSTHKMLSAMTMGAMLHIQGDLLDRELLRHRLTMIQSSSPSYPIMASLDLSRYWLDCAGSEGFEQGLAARDYIVNGLKNIGCDDRPSNDDLGNDDRGVEQSVPMLNTNKASRDMSDTRNKTRFAVVGELPSPQGIQATSPLQDRTDDTIELTSAGELFKGRVSARIESLASKELMSIYQDPFKIVLYDRTRQLSGQQLQKQLERYGCIAEMSDERYVVLVFSAGSQMEDATRLLEALTCIAAETTQVEVQGATHDLPSQVWGSPVSEPVPFHMKPIAQHQMETIPLEQAVGRVCAEMIIPYPPGIPVLYAGEAIQPDVHERILHIRKHNLKVQGAADGSLESIRVYRMDSNRVSTGDMS